MVPGLVLFDWGDTLMVDFRQYSGPMAHWPRVDAVPDACDTLDRLGAAGWVRALATNAADSDEPQIRAALARVGLDGLIDRVYCAKDVGHTKPSAEFFAYALSHAGFSAASSVMVGDSLANDVAGALRAGLRAVLYKPGEQVRAGGNGWWVIGRLSDLPELLDSL